MLQGVFLCFQQISQKGACSDDSTFIILQSQAFQCPHTEMLFQGSHTQVIIKVPALQRIQGDVQPVPDLFQVHAAHTECLITDDFRR